MVSFQDQKNDELRSQTVRDPHQLLEEMIARGEDPHAFLKTQPMTDSMSESNENNVSLRGGTFFSDDEAIYSKKIASSRLKNVGTRNDTNNLSDKILVSWMVPAGWKEKAAGGMRLASFVSETDPNLDVSIVSLNGIAGGVEANINRWMNQMHLASLNEEEQDLFLSKQEKFITENGLSVRMVDFSTLLPEGDQSLPSMLSAIIQLPDKTVFVKMTGTMEEINKNREPFRELCQSLKIR